MKTAFFTLVILLGQIGALSKAMATTYQYQGHDSNNYSCGLQYTIDSDGSLTEAILRGDYVGTKGAIVARVQHDPMLVESLIYTPSFVTGWSNEARIQYRANGSGKLAAEGGQMVRVIGVQVDISVKADIFKAPQTISSVTGSAYITALLVPMPFGGESTCNNLNLISAQ